MASRCLSMIPAAGARRRTRSWRRRCLTVERKALGRGLSSLMGGSVPDHDAIRITQAPIEEIRPNRNQPRQEWDDAALEDLTASIRAEGILQPLIVRGDPGAYELIAGERRLRAARAAGLTHVPVILREADEEGSLKIAL